MKTGDTVDGLLWCEPCSQFHGPHYVCPSYPDEVKQKVQATVAAFRANLADPEWRQRQIEDGTPPEVLAIFDALSGVRR